MPKAKSADIVGKIVDLLTPLSSEERSRIISAARTLLGEANAPEKGQDDDQDGGNSLVLGSGKVKVWQKQNDVKSDRIAEFFHVADGKAEVIAGEMPGKNSRDKSLNAYVLAGLAKFIVDGSTGFTDKEARAICESTGCYDRTNHAKTLKVKGNWFTGSKDKGWTLTGPGLKHAATLLKADSSEE